MSGVTTKDHPPGTHCDGKMLHYRWLGYWSCICGHSSRPTSKWDR